MILKVKRLDLIAAITAKAKANQQAYDDKVAEAASNPNLSKLIDVAIDKEFGEGAVDAQSGKTAGYTKTNAKSAKATLLQYLGLNGVCAAIPKPVLYEAQLAALNLAQDEVLDIEDTHQYFLMVQV